ncbi:terminase, partial [Escherichia coli]
HRDENGKIVKLNDDILSAVRYGYMMRRFAIQMRDIKDPKEIDYSSYNIPCGVG